MAKRPTIAELQSRIQELELEISELMLKYAPGEISSDQILRYEQAQKYVTFCHPDNPTFTFRQNAKLKLPKWAVNIQPEI